jgi:hypothetical protein
MLGNAGPFVTEDLIAKVWFVCCAGGGLVSFMIGARATGLALSGAVVGAIVGFTVVSSDFDLLPQGAMVGATIGTFVCGVFGLPWKPSASVFVLRALGSVTILIGVASVLAGRVASQRLCGGSRHTCLPEIDGGFITLFALDAAWIAALCFIQAAGSQPSDAAGRAPVGRPDLADAPAR